MHSKSLFIVFLIVSYVQVNAQTIGSLSEVEVKKIDSIFSFYKNIPGCAIAVVKNGETLFQKGYGLANLEYEVPITTKTVFDVNAVAKQFTAACVFHLEEEGKLSLDDPLQRFFPDFPEYDGGKLTVKNLLYQTSGLRSYLAILYAQNRYLGDRIDNEDVLQMITNQRNLNFQPGTRYDYSNSNYALLGTIIEKVSGKKMTEYAKEKLFDPLHMTNTFFIDSPNKVIKNRAIGYQQEEDYFVLNHFFNPNVVGDGGLYTNLEDLIRWSNSISSGALGEDLVAKMITPGTLNSGAVTNYAGGLYNQNHYDIEGLPTVRHAGVWAGFGSLYYKFLNQDLAFIIMSNNADTDVWGILDQLTPFFIADEIASAERLASSNNASLVTKEIKLKGKEMEQFSGNFYNKINGNLRTIALVDGKLFYNRAPNVPGSPLSIISTTELVFEAAPFIKLSFEQSHNSMIFTINDKDPIPFESYQGFTYKKTELKEFENNYYNEDLDVIYQIKSKEDQLRILIEGKELVVLSPFAKDMFREEHFGYITFHRGVNGKIKSFSRTDNTFSNLVFHVLKSTVS